MKTIPLNELVFDYALYPRSDVDRHHVNLIREALRAGVTLPPIVIDKVSKRVTDGFHRGRAYALENGKTCKVCVEEKAYKSDAEMFIDAMRYNADHGRRLSTYDHAHCILLAERLEIEPAQVASTLHLTTATVDKLRTGRVGTLTAKTNGKGRTIPIKYTIRHKRGQALTQAQSEVNDKLGGMNQVFYVNQLVMLIEADLLDLENEQLIERLGVLRKLLGSIGRAKAKK